MNVLSTKDELNRRSVVTIGVFDGVHLGHQALLKSLSDKSAGEAQRVVVTFDQHPLNIVAPGYAPKMLTTFERKLELIEQTGLVDSVLVIPFNPVRAAQSATDFVQEVIIDQLHAKHVMIGENFMFGHERKGNVALLERMGVDNDFQVTPVRLSRFANDLPISSTRIRQYISVGDVAKAAELLGRPHEIEGVVVNGDAIGTTLGYPTANTDVDANASVPTDAVYTGRVQLSDGTKYKSAISIGVRPMFHDDDIRAIEPHLIDFEGDLYGQRIKIEFVEKIRDQMVFESVDDLIEQIGKDVELANSTVQI